MTDRSDAGATDNFTGLQYLRDLIIETNKSGTIQFANHGQNNWLDVDFSVFAVLDSTSLGGYSINMRGH